MDQTETFYEGPVDHTPYAAFVWVVGLAMLVTGGLSYAVWHAGSWVKSQRLLESMNRPGSTDALLERVQTEGSSALDQAKQAAEQAAQKAAQDAAAQATQELLQQSDAALKAGADAAQSQVQTQAAEQYESLLHR